MDRQIVWPGAIPLETDILNSERNAMLAIAGIGSALFGSATTANGLVVAPTAVPSMSVSVGPGEIYAVENLDSSAYSSLNPDTAHQIVKQGINLDPVILPCAAPTTAGYSISYLIEAEFVEADEDPVVLPYYNASNPEQAYSGPANSGESQPAKRACSVAVTAKPGIAAATGSQAVPAVDTGFIGIHVVTVPYGATSINAGMITPISGASVVPVGGILAALKAFSYASRADTAAGTSTAKAVTPDALAQAIQSSTFTYGVASGPANALTLTLTPATVALPVGSELLVKTTAANTAATTLQVDGGAVLPVVFNGLPLAPGMLQAGQIYRVVWDGTNFELRDPTLVGIFSTADFMAAGTYSPTVPVWATHADIEMIAGGGAGGGCGSGFSGGGGGAGAYSKGTVNVTPGATLSITIGAGGTPTSTAGNPGGATSITGIGSVNGGGGGQASTSTSAGGGGGGAASNAGVRNFSGGTGGDGDSASATVPGGEGAPTPFGGGGRTGAGSGVAGPAPGSGGGGAWQSAGQGGAGHDGAVYITFRP